MYVIRVITTMISRLILYYILHDLTSHQQSKCDVFLQMPAGSAKRVFAYIICSYVLDSQCGQLITAFSTFFGQWYLLSEKSMIIKPNNVWRRIASHQNTKFDFIAYRSLEIIIRQKVPQIKRNICVLKRRKEIVGLQNCKLDLIELCTYWNQQHLLKQEGLKR